MAEREPVRKTWRKSLTGEHWHLFEGVRSVCGRHARLATDVQGPAHPWVEDCCEDCVEASAFRGCLEAARLMPLLHGDVISRLAVTDESIVRLERSMDRLERIARKTGD